MPTWPDLDAQRTTDASGTLASGGRRSQLQLCRLLVNPSNVLRYRQPLVVHNYLIVNIWRCPPSPIFLEPTLLLLRVPAYALCHDMLADLPGLRNEWPAQPLEHGD